jgi:hypothetical protein
MIPLILAHGGPVILIVLVAFYAAGGLGLCAVLIGCFASTAGWRRTAAIVGVMAIILGCCVLGLLWREVARDPLAFLPAIAGIVLGAVGVGLGLRSSKRSGARNTSANQA